MVKINCIIKFRVQEWQKPHLQRVFSTNVLHSIRSRRHLSFLNFVQLQSINRTQRACRTKFFPKQPKCELNIMAFRRILERFKIHSSVPHQQPIGRGLLQRRR